MSREHTKNKRWFTQAKLQELIRQLALGDETIIRENRQPVARLVSEPPKPNAGLRPPPGLGKGMITLVAPDFDVPLEQRGLRAFRGPDP